MDITTNAQIISIVEERCLHPGSFEEFAARLLNLQVVRLTYDVVSDELFFYSVDKLLVQLHGADIKGYRNSQPHSIAKEYNQQLLEKAIENFDSGKITAAEFHKQIASAGIVYVSVHIPNRKIYYLSQDGKYYLESF